MTYTSTPTAVRWEPWSYRQQDWQTMDLSGFHIEARDGEIGKIDKATQELGGSYLIVDTGNWIFGKKVMLPAGVVSDVDLNGRRVFVDRTKEQIKNAPEFDESMVDDRNHRDQYGSYYGEGGGGWYAGR